MSGFALKRPCPKCPFRTDVPPYLRGDRAREIAHSLASGAEFPCHQTTEEYDDEAGDMHAVASSQFCAGALIVLENEGQPNQIMRTMERLGVYDAASLDADAPVHGSLDAFCRHHGAEEEDYEGDTCAFVETGCLAPAGHMVGGSVVREPVNPEVMLDGGCSDCGEPLCEACADDANRCPNCAEYAETSASTTETAA